jgi:hypothetical protein
MLLGVMLLFDGALLALGNVRSLYLLSQLAVIVDHCLTRRSSSSAASSLSSAHKRRFTSSRGGTSYVGPPVFSAVSFSFFSSGQPSACWWRCSAFSIFSGAYALLAASWSPSPHLPYLCTQRLFPCHPHFPPPITVHWHVPESTLHPPCTSCTFFCAWLVALAHIVPSRPSSWTV